MKRSLDKESIKSTSFYIVGLLAIIAIWIVSSIVINNDIVLPKFINVMKSLKDLFLDGNTYLTIGNTLLKLILSVAFGFVISFILGLLSYLFEGFSYFITPLIAILRTLPVASVSILLLLLIGNRQTPYFITLFVLIPVLYENILMSLKGINKGVIEEVKMMSNLTPYVLFNIYIPIIGPGLISGLISSIGLGLKVMVMAEFISQTPNTIGYELNQEKIFLNIDRVFAWTIVLIIFMIVVTYILKIVQKKAKINEA